MAADTFRHIHVQPGAEAVFFKQRDEIIGKDRPPFLRHPPHQSFRAGQASVVQIDLWLQIQPELPFFQSLMHMALHIIFQLLLFMKLRIVKPDVILPDLSRLIQREHHLGHQPGGQILLPLLAPRPGDAAVEQHMIAAAHQKGQLLDLPHDPVKPYFRLLPVRPFQKQVKIVRRRPSEKFLRSQLSFQDLADILQQPVRLLPSEDLVDKFELMQIQGSHAAFPPLPAGFLQLFHKALQIAASRKRIHVGRPQKHFIIALQHPAAGHDQEDTERQNHQKDRLRPRNDPVDGTHHVLHGIHTEKIPPVQPHRLKEHLVARPFDPERKHAAFPFRQDRPHPFLRLLRKMRVVKDELRFLRKLSRLRTDPEHAVVPDQMDIAVIAQRKLLGKKLPHTRRQIPGRKHAAHPAVLRHRNADHKDILSHALAVIDIRHRGPALSRPAERLPHGLRKGFVLPSHLDSVRRDQDSRVRVEIRHSRKIVLQIRLVQLPGKLLLIRYLLFLQKARERLQDLKIALDQPEDISPVFRRRHPDLRFRRTAHDILQKEMDQESACQKDHAHRSRYRRDPSRPLLYGRFFHLCSAHAFYPV